MKPYSAQLFKPFVLYLGLSQVRIALDAELRPFEFETVRVDRQGAIVHRETRSAFYFVELLGREQLPLELVAIPGGEFLMGSPEEEPERFLDEGPQHPVCVPPFFLGKHPITQAQWKAIATTPAVNQELDPAPSRFRGKNLPVERVSWDEAMEFCARLSRDTGRDYRLPSEAEWEYACRAGTTTPFHFGETLTTDLANYDGSCSYQSEPRGEFRGQTTEAGSFLLNAFGLGEMHGNVGEWCADRWHGNYVGAPNDGSAWLGKDVGVQPSVGNRAARVRRGISWIDIPLECRSANRSFFSADDRSDLLGLRLVCSVPCFP